MAVNILVIDAQGGGIGKQIITAIKQRVLNAEITAVGTNSAATAAMLKAGAHNAATGENAVVVGCRKADIIVGPIGIVIADALLGEITPKMAQAVGQSKAKRILIPINHCDNVVVGVPDLSIATMIQGVVEQIQRIIESRPK
ncbi:MAG: DUF3842 family protein [Bacillota bacterium]|jgi:hypothetical protein